MNKPFTNKVILITGASGGLGRALSLALVAEGASLVLHGRSNKPLEVLYDELEPAAEPVPALIALDFATATEADLEAIAIGIRRDFKRLDAIIHCASHFTPLKPLAALGLDDHLDQWRVNLAAPLTLTRACLPLMRERTAAAAPATVIFISESHGEAAPPFWGSFAHSKAALNRVAAQWQGEIVDGRVRFHTVIPGAMASPQRRVSHPGQLGRDLPTPQSIANKIITLLTLPADVPGGRVWDCTSQLHANSTEKTPFLSNIHSL